MSSKYYLGTLLMLIKNFSHINEKTPQGHVRVYEALENDAQRIPS